MSALYFTSTFKSKQANNAFEVLIKSKTLTAGLSTEFKLTSSGFKLKYSKGEKIKLAVVKTSSLSFGFIVENEADKDQLNTILQSAEGDWYIETTLNGSTYWTGWLKPAYDTYNDGPYPYVVNVKATDSLGRLLNKYNNSINTDGPADYRDIYHPVKLFFDAFDITSLPINAIQVLALFKYWPENLTYNANVNALRKIYYNRNTFVEDAVNYANTIKNYLVELKGTYKSFNLKLIYSGNRYNLIQDNAQDSANPWAWSSTSPDVGGVDFKINNQNSLLPLNIDNSAVLSGTNGLMIAGASFRFDPELNSVRGRYVKGHTLATFDVSNTYASLATIGFLNQGQTALNLNLNVQIKDKWLSSAVTPHAQQSYFMTGLLTCKLKVGTKYLTNNGGYSNINTIGWSWSTDAASTFTFVAGFGTSDINSLENYTIANSGFLANYTEDSPSGYDTAKANVMVHNLSLPILDVFGEIEFSMSGGIVYWQLPTSSVVYTADDYFANLMSNLATNQMPSSTGLNSSNTPAARSNQMLTIPFVNSLQEGAISSPENSSGTYYISSVNPVTKNIDRNLGDFILGNIDSAYSSENTVRLLNGSTYISTGGFDINAGASYKNLTQLLLNEYMSVSNKPTVILQGAIIASNYLPTKPILYNDEIGGEQNTFIFIEGTFTAADDTWAGSWYKLDKSADTFTEEETTIFDPQSEESEPMPGGIGANKSAVGSGVPAFVKSDIKFDGNAQNNLNASNSIGTLTADIAPNTAITSLAVANFRSDLKSGQHFFILDRSSGNGLQLATTADVVKGDTAIPVSFTSTIGYEIGSKIMLAAYDLPNHSGGGENLALGVTSTNIYIMPSEFKTWNKTSLTTYTRDIMGSTQSSAYSSRTKVYSTTFIPEGYGVVSFDVYSNQNRQIDSYNSSITSDSISTLATGYANTTVSSVWTSVLGKYFIISYEIGASTDEIYGAKLTIIKL